MFYRLRLRRICGEQSEAAFVVTFAVSSLERSETASGILFGLTHNTPGVHNGRASLALNAISHLLGYVNGIHILRRSAAQGEHLRDRIDGLRERNHSVNTPRLSYTRRGLLTR